MAYDLINNNKGVRFSTWDRDSDDKSDENYEEIDTSACWCKYPTAAYPFGLYYYEPNTRDKKVQVGKDQEKAQSERDSHSKNRGGKKPN